MFDIIDELRSIKNIFIIIVIVGRYSMFVS